MRACVWALAAALFVIPAFSGPAPAADPPSPEQLRKMYDDALLQLKAAQDRKSELAKENENLKAKVDELSKQLAASQAQSQELRHAVAENAEKTFYLRAYRAAWEGFLRRYPDLLPRWKVFIETDVHSDTPGIPALIDPQWPMSTAMEG